MVPDPKRFFRPGYPFARENQFAERYAGNEDKYIPRSFAARSRSLRINVDTEGQ